MATPTEAPPQLETGEMHDELGSLEFDAELRCEGAKHPGLQGHDDGPGTHLVRLACSMCSYTGTAVLCAARVAAIGGSR